MSAVIPFSFESLEIRVLEIDGEPWFVATDVCRVLKIANPGNAYLRLDDDEKGIHTMDTLGGKQEVVIINESGLYELVLSSRKPEAKRFKKWVKSEVLPAIRKHGRYEMPQRIPRTPGEMIALVVEQFVNLEREVILHGKKIESLEQKLEDLQALPAPATEKVYAHHTIAAFARFVGLRPDLKTANKLGRRCSYLCGSLGIPLMQVADERYGQVNAYPVDVLEAVFKEHYGPTVLANLRIPKLVDAIRNVH